MKNIYTGYIAYDILIIVDMLKISFVSLDPTLYDEKGRHHMNNALTSFCLNPRVRHTNNSYTLRCRDCDFFVKGARVNDYEITGFLGQGGFGDVYAVSEPPPLRRTFALKVLRSNVSQKRLTSVMRDEAQTIANLQHPHILPVYKFGTLENDRPYFVMEYAQKTLKQFFQKPDGSARLVFAEELAAFVEQAAQALEYIHARGFIHLDIKPVNFLVKDEHLYLADFGISKYLGIKTHTSLEGHPGTYRYMPPEQLNGHPRRESDQYALAVSIYKLLTGHTPFEYPKAAQMWHAILSEEPSLPQKWNPRVPVEVSAVLLRAMAKDYQRRYPDMLAFAQAYRAAVDRALQRSLCQMCGHQNRTGAQRCSTCAAPDNTSTCPYCETGVRFGQRHCSSCGRLTMIPDQEQYSIFSGLSVKDGRYLIKRVLKNTLETKMLIALARDTHAAGQLVVLKRWPRSPRPGKRNTMRRSVPHLSRCAILLSPGCSITLLRIVTIIIFKPTSTGKALRNAYSGC
jgi:serine/threonine protein kinase